jgi:hypothetical protein
VNTPHLVAGDSTVQAAGRLARHDLMTGRARAYLLTTALMHGGIGFYCIFEQDKFQSVSYRQLMDVLPLTVWGAGFMLVAVLSIVAAVRRAESFAYLALIFAVVLTSAWASGLISAAVVGKLAGPTGPISWTALAMKDLIQCRMPLRVPLEPVVRDLLADDEDRRERRRVLGARRRS